MSYEYGRLQVTVHINGDERQWKTRLEGNPLVLVSLEYVLEMRLADSDSSFIEKSPSVPLGDGGFIVGQHRCIPVFPIDQEQYERGALVFRVEEWAGWKSDIAALHQQK